MKEDDMQAIISHHCAATRQGLLEDIKHMWL